MKKLLLSMCLLCTFMLQAQNDFIEAVVSNGSTSGNGRAPQGAARYNRSVWIITAAEMAAGGFTANTVLTGIGFNFSIAQDIETTGTFKVYLQNTADAVNNKANLWTTAINGMTMVHNGNVTIPAEAGTFDIPFAGGTPFTYTGGGLYVAFDYANAAGDLATDANTALCNNTITNGLKGAVSATTAPTTLTASNFRPETRLGKAVSCVRPFDVYADAITETSATVHWSAPNPAPANGYDYYINTTGVAPTTTTTPTGSVAAGVTSYAIPNGLTSGTAYAVWVRSKCSGTDVSAWSAVGDFVTVYSPVTPPYAEGFEEEIGGWTLFNAGMGNNWTVLTNDDSATTGITAAQGTVYAAYLYNATNAADAWLFSRRLAMTAGLQYTIGFKYRVAASAGTTYNENLEVKIGAGSTVADQTTTLFNQSNISTLTWTQATSTFTPTTTGNYTVGFHCFSPADRYIMAVDDFTVSAGVASVEESVFNNVAVFPNPATSVIKVSNSNGLVNGVEITDMNGRTVKTVKFAGVNEAQINVSDLSAGMYLMNISSDKGAVTKKIVKQ